MMHTLEVVRAGAGSGKTTDLCDTVATAVQAGLDPARILATTFARKAAAELKGRIQAKLLEGTDGSLTQAQQWADRLELAAIGTVHSVAHQLLARYAIELGLSPRLEVLTEPARDRALRDLLGSTPLSTWRELLSSADQLSISDVPARILSLLSVKRGNRISNEAFVNQVTASANRVCELLAPSGPNANGNPIDRLNDLVDDALQRMEAISTDATKKTAGAKQKLRLLRGRRDSAWSNYLEAARIEAGKTSGADGILDPLRTHAATVRLHPQLHADIRLFANRLAQETIRLESQYQSYKQERGLVDFTDLETLLLELLESEDLADSLAADFDLIMVDEFQDTNPLQLAIFQHLRQLAPRSRWVGDPKQAIYGFRDTDPELVNSVWAGAPDANRAELPYNHRGQRGLVQLIGTLFSPVFGDDAIQQPKRAAKPRGVERWILNSRNQPQDAAALACGIAQLHSEGIRFGDIAVLERTHLLLANIAASLDDLGIPFLMESPGLLSTREGAMVLAGLRLVVDRSDSLAAASVLHVLGNPHDETPEWLTERLKAIRAAEEEPADGEEVTTKGRQVPWENDPRLSPLEDIDRTTLSPAQITHQVIEAISLPTLVRKWDDAPRRCANLDSMLRHAREYEGAAQEAGEAATLTGLVTYLQQLATDGKDVRYPPLGHDAVTLSTYHSAKGLEWPVVVLSGLDSQRAPDLWSAVVQGGDPAADNPLNGRTLQAWIWPFGHSEGPHGGMRTGSGLELDALSSAEGEAAAIRDHNEQMRLLYVGCTRAKTKLVFAHRNANYRWLSHLNSIDLILDISEGEGEHDLDGIDTTFVVRELSPAMVDQCRIGQEICQTWISTNRDASGELPSPRFHNPSSVETPATAPAISTDELSGPSYFPSGAREDQYAAVGEAIHAYLAAIPSMTSIDDAQKAIVAARCLGAFSVSGILGPTILVSAGNRFVQWIEKRYPGATWHTEVPVTSPRNEGGQWIGIIDLLLRLSDGRLVVIDHKSAPIQRHQCTAKAATFAGQVNAYREILTVAGEDVEAAWVHFPLAGILAQIQ